jgi:hypothetical protein
LFDIYRRTRFAAGKEGVDVLQNFEGSICELTETLIGESVRMGSKRKNKDTGKYVWTGVLLGIILGIILDQLALGIALGLVIGYLIKEDKEKK